ncbi:dihydrolipoyl dehydrogenase [Vibrio sp. WXL103]|uniref:dihydrolipoyl dehydrogenase n=1 Tax=Vibrio sp. WXL103 TaxID=3450710 RepID=UPI003EC9060C
MSGSINVDLVVLGGGPGGYTAAFRAADLGLSVCIVEQRDTLGGVCVNVGCIPSKTLLHATSLIEQAQSGAAVGIEFTKPTVNLDTLRDHKQSTIARLTGGIAQLAKARKVITLQGRGQFIDRHSLSVRGDEEQLVNFKHAIIATGSYSTPLPFAPDDKRVWNSTDALSLSQIPEKLLIVGGGIIGLEMAQVYAALGSQITIVEAQSQLIPAADKDILQPLLKTVKKRYQILTATEITSMTAQPEGIDVTFAGRKATEQATFDAVLVAIGRRPNTQGIGLDSLGIELDERGLIEVDHQQRTNVDNIFAIGDIVDGPMLAHKATHEGKCAAESIVGLDTPHHTPEIPSVAYTHPEIAWVGITEKQAKLEGIDYRVGKVPWQASGRAQSVGATNGATKALFDAQSGKLIGAAICGENAGELIHEAVSVMNFGGSASDIAATVHAHPTLAETFAFAAELVDGSVTDMMPSKRL